MIGRHGHAVMVGATALTSALPSIRQTVDFVRNFNPFKAEIRVNGIYPATA
jgi:hypothetical protein